MYASPVRQIKFVRRCSVHAAMLPSHVAQLPDAIIDATFCAIAPTPCQ